MGSDEVVLNVRRVLDMLKFCLVEVLVGFALVAVLVQTQTHPLGFSYFNVRHVLLPFITRTYSYSSSSSLMQDT